MQLEHSRSLDLAGQVTGDASETLPSRLEQSLVVVSADPDRPEFAKTVSQLIDTLRRLPIQIRLSPGDLSASTVQSIVASAAQVDPARPVEVGNRGVGGLRVHVGYKWAKADIHGIPERHGVHIAAGAAGRSLAPPTDVTGLGVMTASAFLAAEVFKHVVDVVPGRRFDHDHLSWCPVTLSDTPLDAPQLPTSTQVELAVVGLGAIGSAITRILSDCPIGGSVLLVDPERFAPENVGTYSLGGADAAVRRPWKVDLASAVLTRFTTREFRGPVEELVEAIDNGTGRWPRIVLSGLDSAQARREVQRLWPDRLIDGATGDTMCGMHDVAVNRGACLMCLFPTRTEGPSATERLSAVTGIATDVLRYGDQPLTQAHLTRLPEEKQRLLRSQVGKPICGLAEAIGLSELSADSYRPAAPFVSQQAASLVVGRLFAHQLSVQRMPGFVQYDALIGPQAGTIENRAAEPKCFCQQRASVIDAVRTARAASSPPSNL